MHAQFHAFGRTLGDPEQLDSVAELLCVLDVGRVELGDALDVRLVEAHRIAEGDGAHDRQLVRRIDAFDVEGRIGLGVAQTLRFLEHGFEAQALVAHFGQDEVGRPVDDPGDPLDAVGGQPFAQGLDDRDAAGHCCFESDGDALLLRRVEDLVAVGRQQRLVGRHHVLPVFDGLEYEFLGHTVTADQLDDDIDFRIGDDREGIVGQPAGTARDLLRKIKILVRNHRDLDGPPRAARDFLGIALENSKGATTDSADAEKSNVDRFHFRAFLRQNEGTTVPSREKTLRSIHLSANDPSPPALVNRS